MGQRDVGGRWIQGGIDAWDRKGWRKMKGAGMERLCEKQMAEKWTERRMKERRGDGGGNLGEMWNGEKEDRWMGGWSISLSISAARWNFTWRGEPYGDDSARQPNNLWFNPVYTHTHTHRHCSVKTAKRVSRCAEFSSNTCHSERGPSIKENEPRFKPAASVSAIPPNQNQS